MASRLPLRLRVALAFTVTTALALLGLGLFVQLRVTDTLEGHLDDSLEAQLDRIDVLPPDERAAAVRGVVGETFVQLLTPDAALNASSAQAVSPLIGAGDVPSSGTRRLEREISLVDTDADDLDDAEPGETVELDIESEPSVLLVRRVGDQVLVVGTSREDTDEALEEVRDQLLIGGPLALLLAALLGYVVAGGALRPIERIRARAATISDRSSDERLPVPAAHDELRRLTTTLNEMLDRLDAGLQRERRFVADASHELRTPLALMRMEIDLALSRPRSAEELAAALRSADEETERLIGLAEDLLSLAASDRQSLTLDRRQLDLTELASDVVRRFAPLAEESGRTVTVAGGTDGVLLHADGERLDQVLTNLLDNALRHGEGPVVVGVRRQGDACVLTVSDTGPGISEPRPFDRFTGAHGGRGLGLAIVRAVVEAHGGTVEAGSGAQGIGTTITVTLQAGD